MPMREHCAPAALSAQNGKPPRLPWRPPAPDLLSSRAFAARPRRPSPAGEPPKFLSGFGDFPCLLSFRLALLRPHS